MTWPVTLQRQLRLPLRIHSARAARNAGASHLKPQLRAQTLRHCEALVTAWVIVHSPDNFEAEAAVKIRRLEVMSLQDDLSASALTRLGFDLAHEAAAVSLATHMFGNVEIADVAGSSPSPSVYSAYDRIHIVPQEYGKQSAIRYSCRLDIVFVDALFKEANVFWPWLGFDCDDVHTGAPKGIGPLIGKGDRYPRSDIDHAARREPSQPWRKPVRLRRLAHGSLSACPSSRAATRPAGELDGRRCGREHWRARLADRRH